MVMPDARREARPEEDDQEGDEPSDARSRAAEDECAERRHDAPQADAAGGQEAADRDHRQRRCEQDRQELDMEQERRRLRVLVKMTIEATTIAKYRYAR